MSHVTGKIERFVEEIAPRVLPSGWALHEDYDNAKIYLRSAPSPLSVILEVAFYESRCWLHVSVSGRQCLPTWEVKDLFVGRERCALQVLPPASEYVNVDPNVLHLWCALEGPRPVPDFTRGRKII